MAEKTPQTFANHAKFDPPFHFILMPLLLINLLAVCWHTFRHPTLESAWLVVLSVAALLAVFLIRRYALKVQDRVIRLEERQRLALLLPERLRSRIPELREGQLVALRFASDAELPDLVEQALAGDWKGPEIKKQIVQWRPDYFRV